MGSSNASRDCSPSSYWEEIKSTGETGAALGASVGAVGGAAAVGAFVGAAGTVATDGWAAPLIMSSAADGVAISAADGSFYGGLVGGSIEATHHAYICLR